jgi:hypothetical protein
MARALARAILGPKKGPVKCVLSSGINIYNGCADACPNPEEKHSTPTGI